MQGRVKEKERELQRQFIEKERHLQEAQMLMEKKLGDAEHRLVTLQNGKSHYFFMFSRVHLTIYSESGMYVNYRMSLNNCCIVFLFLV